MPTIRRRKYKGDNQHIRLRCRRKLGHTLTHYDQNYIIWSLLLACWQPNTFQLVLMSDRNKKKTYVVYLYDPTGSDNPVSVRPTCLGYIMTKNGKIRSKTIEVSNTSNPFRVADLEGNPGKFVWFKGNMPTILTSCCDEHPVLRNDQTRGDWTTFIFYLSRSKSKPLQNYLSRSKSNLEKIYLSKK